MSVRILLDAKQGTACMFDSVTGTAFGPIFTGDTAHELDAYDACAAFILQCTDRDPRQMTDKRLRDEVAAWARGTFSDVVGELVEDGS